MQNLHDLTEAVLNIGGEGEGDIGGEVGDANALRDHLNRLLRYDTHRFSLFFPSSASSYRARGRNRKDVLR